MAPAAPRTSSAVARRAERVQSVTALAPTARPGSSTAATSRLLVGPQRNVIDIDHPAALLQLVEERAELGLIGPPQGVRLGQDLGQPFQSLEERRVAEREIELGRVEDVEDDHLVAAVAEVLQAGEDPRHVVEQVGEDRPPRRAS